MNKQEALDALELYHRNMEHILGPEDEKVKTIGTCIQLVEEIPENNGGDTIPRQAAIDEVKHYIEIGYDSDIIHTLGNLPSAQPELIEQGAYVRGFEQGRTQGMIDSTIKAEWTNADALATNLQLTCNNLATDCISRQAAIDAIWSHATKILENSDYDLFIQDIYTMAHRHIAELIEQLPSAQPEPKTGKWIVHPEVKNVYGGTYIECSQCGEKYVVQHMEDEKYCRNCGAKMEDENE